MFQVDGSVLVQEGDSVGYHSHERGHSYHRRQNHFRHCLDDNDLGPDRPCRFHSRFHICSSGHSRPRSDQTSHHGVDVVAVGLDDDDLAVPVVPVAVCTVYG